MKISIIHDYANQFGQCSRFHELDGHQLCIFNTAYRDDQRVIEEAGDCEVLVLTQQRVPINRAILEKLPQLKLICQTGRNVNHIDITACSDHGVFVSAGQITHAESPYSTTAELTWGLIIASLRQIPYEVERFKAGHWHSTVGSRLSGQTLGIYAFGHIGSAVARVGKAFGMNVVCWGREGSLSRAKAEGFALAESRERFFSNADIVSLHLPGNQHTQGIITAADLALMKPTSLLVNTGRAPIIEKGALVTALKLGRPGFAAIDVFEEEPVLGATHPLLHLPNALCTPHLGYAETQSYEAMYTSAIDRILAYAQGRPTGIINPKAS